jgi:hypothetical protein
MAELVSVKIRTIKPDTKEVLHSTVQCLQPKCSEQFKEKDHYCPIDEKEGIVKNVQPICLECGGILSIVNLVFQGKRRGGLKHDA